MAVAAISCTAAPAISWTTSDAVAAVPHAAAVSSKLHAVTCTSATHCFAVGEYFPSAAQARPLIERWNGTTWSIVASPAPAGAKFSRLYGVSCASAANCVAVGAQSAASTGTNKPLVERWNGKKWSIIASPGTSGSGISSELHGVSCTSATACFAVGLQSLSTTTCCKTLIERWNGSKWSIVAYPPPPNASYARLDGVTCTSASKCVAVGYFSVNGRSNPLVQRWNGTAWSIVPSPNPEIGEGGWLSSVSCTSATNCVAAGAYNLGGTGRPATLIERWNGSKWSIVTNPVPARSYNLLSSVACATPSSCMAVGDYNRSNAPPPYYFLGTRTLIERWNGKAWSIVASPNSTVPYNTLAGVACPTATACFAVGSKSAQAFPNSQVLVEHWNGTAWSIAKAPHPTASG